MNRNVQHNIGSFDVLLRLAQAPQTLVAAKAILIHARNCFPSAAHQLPEASDHVLHRFDGPEPNQITNSW